MWAAGDGENGAQVVVGEEQKKGGPCSLGGVSGRS